MGKPFKMCTRRLSVFDIYFALNGGAFTAPDRGINGSTFGKQSFHNRAVFAVDFTSGDHGGQKRSAVHVAGQNQQPGRIAVQSVNAAVGEGFVF